MTPPARTQAAIELLDQIIDAARDGGAAADTLIARYFGARRYAGSKDRRAVRELVYAAVRRAGEVPETGRVAMIGLVGDVPELAATFDGSTHAPAAIGEEEHGAEPGVAPAWLIALLAESAIEPEAFLAMVERAPLDLRVNSLVATRDAVLSEMPEPVVSPRLGEALRLASGTNVETLAAWRSGAVEVQDEGSQIVGLAVEAHPGQSIVDLCAGAGGKTLALAARMGNDGLLLACDTDRGRLSRLGPRAARAGASIIETRLLNPGQEVTMLDDWRARADTVLVDAPCSGTGTWRRNPEARWRLNPDRLAKLRATQMQVLEIGAALVRPGGALVYIVCSLLDGEGRDQVDGFLGTHRSWQAEPLSLPAGRLHGQGVRLDPARDGTDGFYVARLRAPC